jgi:hypothetical protein
VEVKLEKIGFMGQMAVALSKFPALKWKASEAHVNYHRTSEVKLSLCDHSVKKSAGRG